MYLFSLFNVTFDPTRFGSLRHKKYTSKFFQRRHIKLNNPLFYMFLKRCKKRFWRTNTLMNFRCISVHRLPLCLIQCLLSNQFRTGRADRQILAMLSVLYSETFICTREKQNFQTNIKPIVEKNPNHNHMKKLKTTCKKKQKLDCK